MTLRRPRAPIFIAIALSAIAAQRLILKFQLDVVKLHQRLILLGQGVFGLCENAHQILTAERLASAVMTGMTADQFRDDAELQQVVLLHLAS